MEQLEKYEAMIGTMIDDRYRIISVRGIGGMAAVFKAEDTHMNRTVALKILSDSYALDEEAVRRFVNESKAVALLDHEHIVSIYDVAFDSNRNYIVMEYLDGLTLKEYMMKKGKLSVEEALDFTHQILSALEHAHEKGVIHRDIKPQNILLLSDGIVKVADFGIAKTPDSKNMPNTEKAMGTVHYISPEQAAGNPTGFYTDLYSVGVMLYEMVTGRLPFEADTPLAVAMMQINNQATPPRKIDPAVPKGLEQIILKSMSKKPENRFKSARSMLRAVEIIREKPNAVFEDRPRAIKTIAPEVQTVQTEEKNGFWAKLFGVKNSEKKAPRTLFPVILGVFSAFFVIACSVAAIFLISFFNGSLSNFGYSQKVPDLIGSAYNDALVDKLDSNNYVVRNIIYHYDESCEPYTIISQEPAAGTTRKAAGGGKKIELTLTLSLGQQSVPLPDLAMMNYEEAQKLLEERNLTVQLAQEYSDVVTQGKVIKTEPSYGTPASAGDVVILYYSRGENVQMVNVPKLVGLSYDEAVRLLEENGLTVGNETFQPSSAGEGVVLEQSREPGTKVAKGKTKIDLVLSIPNA